ncbi:MAG: Phosphopantothenoylcysteine decarboxylase (EC / Phosphopantothenoylcysteine synthetase (EC [uncultured Thiotrichaceae bacterium]|uniref:Coenzyme A biosynthesis bifunctional protein CoaBC n=1 Tax=uncultured Thiotrichaceae bacterium TaxID=298394 RepID=A0A6S6SNA2_9GAMM|nr:MAG: Phosphopantothenoylcysteine decarboxylase (EC / Phosphopantothenoylcysteine synthetase (EC [uncultured Thiotrichaceae bacterium]
MANLQNQQIILGISGGIAAYKSAELARLLIKSGAKVRVCMTQSACEFITPLTFQALTGNPVHTELFDLEAEAAMGHIELARWADRILIAPASANTMAKIAHGFSDSLLTTLCLATKTPVVIVPAMNQQMWRNRITQKNVSLLEQSAIRVLMPAAGEQACGDIGPGRMQEPQIIVDTLGQENDAVLSGVNIMITAGPTQEAIDPVRYITNRSSGKMGFAIAEAAEQLGANVTLVAGPVNLETPRNVNRIDVKSAENMFDAVKNNVVGQHIFIASAAVADYQVAKVATQKIKKKDESISLALSKTSDILAEISTQHNDLFTVGFAAETEDLKQHAMDKLHRKKLDMIAANKVGNGQGFDVDDNALQVLWKGGEHALPLTSKKELAKQLMQLITTHYQAR